MDYSDTTLVNALQNTSAVTISRVNRGVWHAMYRDKKQDLRQVSGDSLREVLAKIKGAG